MTLNKLVIGFIVGVFLLIISVWTLMGYVGGKIIKEVDEKGAKHIVERIWEGPQTTEDSSGD